MALQEVLIPDIGDAEDVEVIEILAKVGSDVSVDDPLIVIESDKASMEVPATVAGKLQKIAVSIGDKVHEGQVIATIEASGAGVVASNAAKAAPAKQTSSEQSTAKAARPNSEAVQATAAAVVRDGGGVVKKSGAVAAEPAKTQSSKQTIEVRIPDIGDAKDVVVVEVAVKAGQTVALDDLLVVVESDKASMEIPAPVAGRILSVDVVNGASVEEGTLLAVIETTDTAMPSKQPAAKVPDQDASTSPDIARQQPSRNVAGPTASEAPVAVAAAPPNGNVYAGPAVRRLARELGVDLAKVKGTGPHGRVVKTDIDGYVRSAMASAARPTASGSAIPPIPTIDFTRFGEIEAVALTRIRARGAENLHRSWLNVPHVTQHDEADVSDLEAFREELKAEALAKGVKLTPLAFIVKAAVATLKLFPTFNASLDSSVRNLIVKRYFHIGLAVDTPEGLVVPVLRNADQKGVFDLAKEIEALSQKAQQNKLGVADLQGASFTISSLGAIGGTGFTPIINAPEVAILGVSRLTVKPHWNGSAFEPRRMLPVSLSYDHRAINGAEAGRFVTSLCRTLKDMRRVLL